MLSEETNDLKISHHPKVDPERPRRVANILIVDDDVESAVAVESTFRQCGCNVEFALNAMEAQRKISAGKADVIILDWMLDPQTSADKILNAVDKRLKKFPANRAHGYLHRPKIITFSSKNEFEIDVPQSSYYVHVDHWLKPLMYPDLTRKTLNLMNRLGF